MGTDIASVPFMYNHENSIIMLKRYKSKSCISLSVKLSTGGSSHVSFTPLTGGGSLFYTDNEKIQEGLEKHPKFGKLFHVEKLEEQTVSNPPPKASVDSEGGTNGTNENLEGDSTLRKMEVLCNDDAKEYLATKFSISRSKLRSRVQIEAAGKANGIQFVWVNEKKTDEPSEDEEGSGENDDENSESMNDDEV